MGRERERRTGGAGDRQRLRAKALADPTRFAAYQYIRAEGPALSVSQITGAVGVHHTAVRAHLAKLVAAGLVSESHAEPSGPGRPKLLYTAISDSTTVDPGRDPYRELSSMLARVVRDGDSPRHVGAVAGRESALRKDPGGTTDTVELIEREAHALGFEPARRGRPERPDLVLQHCPFADVAADDPESICSLHLGVAEGIAERHGDVEVLGMVVRDPHRAGCRLRLRRVDPNETSSNLDQREDTT